ncbi:hypothetical protein D0T49_04145 [Paludibacter sp. 221]|uniref:metallophosphoesterase family protein n=1 Tax=Paludibacter sp. 221 TaxID=2302939 RepID=UPI0013CFA65A|nr:metallophosphoesterase [Paludibacter sp. 221]NDV46231.1 hypothetical protein [Paludibacter sp. 221]
MSKIYSILLLSALLLSSCELIYVRGALGIGIDNVNSRYEFSNSQNFNCGFSSLAVGADEYRVYAAADFHTGKGGLSSNQATFLQAVNDDAGAVCCLSIGDMVSGEKQAYENYSAVLRNFPEVNHAACVGNHELYFEGWPYYKEMFGSSIYYFEVATPNYKDIFICLDSGSGTLGTSQTVWLKDLLERERRNYRNCIVFTHTNFTCKDLSQGTTGSFVLEETYALFRLFSTYNVSMVLSGHDHYFEDSTVQGVRYITLDAAKDNVKNASFLKINCSDSISYEIVKL